MEKDLEAANKRAELWEEHAKNLDETRRELTRITWQKKQLRLVKSTKILVAIKGSKYEFAYRVFRL